MANGKRVSRDIRSSKVNLFRLFQFGIKDVTMCITEGDVFKRNVISIPWSNSIRAPDIELGPTGALIYS